MDVEEFYNKSEYSKIDFGSNPTLFTKKELLDFANEYLEAITVIRCCETLKDKEPISFVDWLKKWNWKQIGNSYVFKRDNSYVDAESLLRSYRKEYNL